LHTTQQNLRRVHIIQPAPSRQPNFSPVYRVVYVAVRSTDARPLPPRRARWPPTRILARIEAAAKVRERSDRHRRADPSKARASRVSWLLPLCGCGHAGSFSRAQRWCGSGRRHCQRRCCFSGFLDFKLPLFFTRIMFGKQDEHVPKARRACTIHKLKFHMSRPSAFKWCLVKCCIVIFSWHLAWP
jgi:hypothetical protein